MVTSRRRLAAIIAVFALVFALGVAWLVRTAMADTTAQPTAGPGAEIGSSPEPTGNAGLGGGPRPGGGAGPGPGGPATTGHRTTPNAPRKDQKAPPPAQTVRVNGPLGGGPMDDSCRYFINPFEVTLTVRSVSLTSADAGLFLDHEHCPVSSFGFVKDLKPCRSGAEISAGGACYTGVELAPEKRVPSGEPFDEYEALAKLAFTARCVAADVTPCSQDEVARHSPSPSNPVKIEWSATADIPFLTVGEKKNPEQPESPDPSPSS